MHNPWRRLQSLPWLQLIQSALLTIAIATLLDIGALVLLAWLYRIWPQGSLWVLQGGIRQVLLQLLAAGGIGALAVVVTERLFRAVWLDAGTLWALLGCLALGLFGKTLLPVPPFLVDLSYLQLIGIMVGLFSQGRRYWHR